jgi:erythritol transport system ATP-binding protein
MIGRPDHLAPVLRAEGIVKRYPGTTALDHVDYNVYPGRVNVLLGENGAGKSTLMKILAGVETPTEGRLLLRGEEVHLSSPREALGRGIGIIYQELNMFPNLSVAENIFVGRELVSPAGTVRHREQRERARSALERLEQSIDPTTLAGELRIGQQQLVEIARALSEDVSILIMDEPTSALSEAETDVLLRLVRELASQGVAIIYISHRLNECLRVGDHFTVLRDGRVVAEASDVTLDWIVRKMSGRAADALFERSARTLGPTVLSVEDLTLPRAGDRSPFVDRVSFSVRAGEIVGVYGLLGAGRTELMECIFGIHPDARGRIRLGSKDIQTLSIAQRIAAGLAFVPEDRQLLGLVQSLSVAQNITLASLKRITTPSGISRSKERTAVRELITALGIRLSDPDQPITTLSGGNQQKVVIAKSLLTEPKVLMMDEPGRGVDVGAKADIFGIMKELAGQRIGILFASSELREIVAMADRALVMARGRLAGTFEGDEITESHLADASVQSHGTG